MLEQILSSVVLIGTAIDETKSHSHTLTHTHTHTRSHTLTWWFDILSIANACSSGSDDCLGDLLVKRNMAA